MAKSLYELMQTKYDIGRLRRSRRQRHMAQRAARDHRKSYLVRKRYTGGPGNKVVVPDAEIERAGDGKIDFTKYPWIVPPIDTSRFGDPIEIRGILYRHARHAAKRLGVKPKTLYNAIYSDRLDRVGLGRGGHNKKPITIRFFVYESRTEAGRVLGVTPTAIRQAEKAGRAALSRVGRGAGGFKASRCKPIVWKGIEFASRAALARHLGVTPGAVGGAIRRGTLDDLGRKGEKAVAIRGTEYPSYGAAAKALGVDPSVVSIAAKKGRLDSVGLGKGYRSDLRRAR